MAKYELHHVVTLDETNSTGNVYFANFFSWQGWCRERFLCEHAPGVLLALRTNLLRLVTTKASCEYFSDLWPFDDLTIRMHLDDVTPTRLSAWYEYWRKTPAGDQLVARGNQEVACLAVQNSEETPVHIPDELRVAAAKFTERSITAASSFPQRQRTTSSRWIEES
jgi:enediyne biosynthesis thioesterase